MEWYGWVAWAIAGLAGITGAVLGIRAERRASHYEPLWVFQPRSGAIQIYNRTGEDATRVKVSLEGGAVHGRDALNLVQPDEMFEIYVAMTGQNAQGFNVNVIIEWTRPKTGKRYRQPKKPRTASLTA